MEAVWAFGAAVILIYATVYRIESTADPASLSSGDALFPPLVDNLAGSKLCQG